MSATLIYTVDGNLGRRLEVYDDRCVILRDGGRAEFLFEEISVIKFRNLSFFMSGYIKLESRAAGNAGLRSGENCFVFSAPPGPLQDTLIAQMPAVFDFIAARAVNARAVEY